MENDDLAKKLERISLPEIELKSHKTKLRLLLMDRYSPERKRGQFWGILNKLIPATALTIILLFVFFGKINFRTDNLVKAREIALQNTEIKNWVEEGATIKDIQLIDGKAYVLIEPAGAEETSETLAAPQESPAVSIKSGKTASENAAREESFKGAVAEVDIKEKKIKNIEKLAPTFNDLIKNKKERALEIAKKSSEVQEVVPKEAEVLDINVQTPKFRLEKEGDKISAKPDTETDEKASIIYGSDGKRWEGKINLNSQEVEEVKTLDEVKTLEETENSAT